MASRSKTGATRRTKTSGKSNAKTSTKTRSLSSQARAPTKAARNVTFSSDGGLVIINAPPQYRSMKRFFARPTDAPDTHDAIHLFVDDAVELEKLLPDAQGYQGERTRFYVLFRHEDRMNDSRDAITNVLVTHGYRRTTLISMGDSDWAGCGFVRSVKT